MRALTVVPGVSGSARLEERAEPSPGVDQLLVAGIAVGLCGTDHEIVAGTYGWPPPGHERLVIGHESVGRVVAAPSASGFAPGDVVVGMVRRPDPVPCGACAVRQWDMCQNGRYTEYGIKELDGFAAERYALPVDAAVAVPVRLGALGVLTEPASIVAKAWEHIDHIGRRAAWAPERVLVTGAGPIGLLAALFAVDRGYDVHVLDIVSSGPKPALVRDMGATFHSGSVVDACGGADIVVECTGVGELVYEVLTCTAPAGIVCLTGVSSGGRLLGVDLGATSREMVLQNDVVFGSVNANEAHYRAGIDALLRVDPTLLSRVISRWVPLDEWPDALRRRHDDVKVVLDLETSATRD
jgi:threonine dehydrogenase-like Zn-dependent dehydrogenase